MSILILPQNIANKIAAGEVIERPASVVKELVENAIDAGAHKIAVDLENGGAALIRVVDDGCGMDESDLALAFLSHATSKLKEEADLFRIATMGFRGEALSSIGAVSHARIVSRTADSDEGHQAEVDGGVIGPVTACGAPVGTQVEVRNLFYNVPVRRKFLKSTATEMAHTSEAITRLALGHPGEQFILTHNGRIVFNLPPAPDRGQRIGEFFGREIAENLIPFRQRRGGIQIEGYLLPPAIDRSSTVMQYTYVNGRYVRDRSLSHAIMEAYQGMMLPQRRPVCFIFLTVDSSEVDVNVHPTKIEVRFRHGRQVHNELLEALRSALREAKLTPQVAISALGQQASGETQQVKESIQRAVWDFFGSKRGEGKPPQHADALRPVIGAAREDTPPPTGTRTPSEQKLQVRFGNSVQVLDSYIIEETNEGINLIDQHALHERLLYNEMKRRLAGGPLNSQRLLVPELVELPRQEFYALVELREELARFGLVMEPFGDSTIIVRAFPQVLRSFDARAFFRDLIDEFEGPERLGKVEGRFEKLLKVIACKGAIKAGQRLGPSEVRHLLQRRASEEQTDTCPHGRPTAIFLSRKELERQFRRT